MKTLRAAAPLLLALTLSTSLTAQPAPMDRQVNGKSSPIAAPIPQTVADAVDAPYPGGTVLLDIDATDITRGAYRVTQTFPVAPGTRRLTLLLPEWLPGNHGPRGTLAELVDIRFLVNGQPVRWTRDPVEVFAFHVDLPEGATQVVAKMTHTSPLQSSEGRITMTQEMLNLQWEKMTLYPAGHYVRQIRVRPTVTFPQGWTVYTALDGQSAAANRVTWAETDYETLVDSPIFAGKYAQRWDLGQNVFMSAVADKPELLAIKPENMATYRALVDEALLTFGAKHFDHYDFLLALTDRMGGIGLEHHRSSENQQEPKSWTEWEAYDWDRNVIAHEFAHSWDGKYRRPAKLWTPDYRTPMQDNLLWVYEGQTQFWGVVHSARAGIQKKETMLGSIANWAAGFSDNPGRAWRSVEDTTHDPIFAARKAKPFASLARNEDYYTEGALVWLEADQIIRQGTGGRRGLDDFAKAFFGMRDGDWGVLTYDFDEVVRTLNGVYPYDWAGFLNTRINQPNQPAPLAGIEKAGYRLVWKDTPNPFEAAVSKENKSTSFTYSLGFGVDSTGKVTSTKWDSPAFNAGIVTGTKIVAVNGVAYDADALKAAVTAAKASNQPIQLLTQRGTVFQTVPLSYTGGLRYPWLEKATPGNAPNGLDRLLAPRRPGAKNR